MNVKELLAGKDLYSIYDHDVYDSARFVVLETMKIYDEIKDIKEVYQQSEIWTDEENESKLPTILVTYIDGNDVEDVVKRTLEDDEYGVGIYRHFSNLNIDYITVPYLEHLHQKYKDSIFPTPYSVLDHIIATAGNGVSCYDFEMKNDTRPYNKRYSIGTLIDELKPQPIFNIYPYRQNGCFLKSVEMFPDTDYRRIKDIEKYVKLFVDCIEMTTKDSLMEYFNNNEEVKLHYFKWTPSSRMESEMNKRIEETMEDMDVWKANINEFKDFYGV